jgi:hypothetical protein
MTKKTKPKRTYNPYIPLVYQVELIRNKTRKALLEEYMIFLINLYGHLIQDGTKRISDFENMTMLDIRTEVTLRTRAMRGENNSKIRAYQEKEQKKIDKLMKDLSQLR